MLVLLPGLVPPAGVALPVVPGVPVGLPVVAAVVPVLPVAVAVLLLLLLLLPGMPEVDVLLPGVPMLLLGMPLGMLPGMLALPMLLLLLGLVAVVVVPVLVGVAVEEVVGPGLPVVAVGVAVLLGTLPGMLEVLVAALPTLPLLGMLLGILPGTVVLPMLLLLLGVLGLPREPGVVLEGLPMVAVAGVAGLALPKPPWACACCEAANASTETAISGAARLRRERDSGVVDMGTP